MSDRREPDVDADPGGGVVNDEEQYKVVVNHEEQYSIWPARRPLPAGWKEAGKTGSKDECLAYIKEVWTDMRPRSVREGMESPPPE